jgi:hypothetical protein
MPFVALARIKVAARRASADDELIDFVDALTAIPFGEMHSCLGIDDDLVDFISLSSSAAML